MTDRRTHRRECAQVAKRYHTAVPVLIITRGAERDELPRVVRALLEALTDDPRERMRNRERMRATNEWAKLRHLTSLGMASAATPASPAAPKSSSRSSISAPPSPAKDGSAASNPVSATSVSALCPRIQLLQERDEQGQSMIGEANAIIDQATKRCYSETREPYFRVTVTDWFGGRGHDFDCLSEQVLHTRPRVPPHHACARMLPPSGADAPRPSPHVYADVAQANENGGMLVIATTIPDAREWAQWKGRTARQDRPGQYLVVLSADDEPFCNEPGLAASLRQLPPDAIINELLRRKDVVTAEALGSFEAQQARGAWQNEVCEAYYKAHPRPSDARWPLERVRTDVKLREMLSVPFDSGAKIAEAASERLGIEVRARERV